MIVRATLIGVMGAVLATQMMAEASPQPQTRTVASQDEDAIVRTAFDAADAAYRAANNAEFAARTAETLTRWQERRESDKPGEDSLYQARIDWHYMGAPLDYRWIWVRNGLEVDLATPVVTDEHSTFWSRGQVKDDSGEYVHRYRALRVYCFDRTLAYGERIESGERRKAAASLTDAEFGNPELPDLETLQEFLVDWVCKV